MRVRKKYIAVPALAIAAALASLAGSGIAPIAQASDGAPEWGYMGSTGPSHWGELGYPVCAQGEHQSPIDISAANRRGLRDPQFAYGTIELTLAATGHGVEAAPVGGSPAQTVIHEGRTYTFAQFHHHAPSEHQVDGLHYPAEIHFVHRAKDGSLAVFGVLVKGGGAQNEAWQPVLDVITEATEDPAELSATVDLDALLPQDRRSFRYAGSLTTPPCTEGVTWTVFTTPVVVSSQQLNDMLEAYSGNNRPVQPLNDRTVIEDRSRGR